MTLIQSERKKGLLTTFQLEFSTILLELEHKIISFVNPL